MTEQLNMYGICKHFSKQRILKAAEITLNSGALTLLTGANGSGKTTLLRILAGLERPEYAEIILARKTFTWPQARRRLLEKTVYLHQRPYLMSGSVLDNLNYALSVAAMPKRNRARRIDEALAWGNLERLIGREATTLSGGEQQRIALIRACLTDPEILLLDEPAANIDLESRDLLMSLLQRLKQRGLAMVMSCHDPHCFRAVADEHLQLSDGRLSSVIPESDNLINIPIADRFSRKSVRPVHSVARRDDA